MRGTEHRLHLCIGGRTRILVVDCNQDRGAERLTMKQTGEDTAYILFLTGSNDVTLTRTTTVEFNLYLPRSERETWRTAINHASDSTSVGLAPG